LSRSCPGVANCLCGRNCLSCMPINPYLGRYEAACQRVLARCAARCRAPLTADEPCLRSLQSGWVDGGNTIGSVRVTAEISSSGCRDPVSGYLINQTFHSRIYLINQTLGEKSCHGVALKASATLVNTYKLLSQLDYLTLVL